MWLHVLGALFGVFNAVAVVGQGGGGLAALGWLVASLLMAGNVLREFLRAQLELEVLRSTRKRSEKWDR